MFKVQRKQCNQCLFTKNKIVDDERKAGIIKECLENGTHFVCHKETMTDPDNFDMGLCCKGFFDKYKTQPIRMATAMRVVEFVEVN